MLVRVLEVAFGRLVKKGKEERAASDIPGCKQDDHVTEMARRWESDKDDDDDYGPKLSQIMHALLWKPLGMDSAAFFLQDGDPRILKMPQLYGALSSKPPHEQGGYVKAAVLPYNECLPQDSLYPNTVAGDQQGGARMCESGDTGATMTVSLHSRHRVRVSVRIRDDDGLSSLSP